MANPEENADGEERVEEDTDAEDTEDTDEDEADADDSEDSDDDSEEDDSDEDEDDEEDSEDSDDSEEDSTPLTKKERLQLKKLQARYQRSRSNKSAAARRKSKEGALSKTHKVDDSRISNLEKTAKQLALAERKRVFGYKTGLAPDEVDTMYRITGRLKSKDLKDPVVKGALDGYRSSKRVKGNVPGAPSRTFRPNSKEFKNATPEERRTIFHSRRQEILAGKK